MGTHVSSSVKQGSGLTSTGPEHVCRVHYKSRKLSSQAQARRRHAKSLPQDRGPSNQPAAALQISRSPHSLLQTLCSTVPKPLLRLLCQQRPVLMIWDPKTHKFESQLHHFLAV